ncbi:thioredoxin family protein [Aestuariibaculum sediminum]|uniref:Thioredoxin family protein n=1 Tax=Aestuariibaculum sediminum TaxID=2770637 RepID=A0A8J6U7Z5_9FLAO|nr:thioredoxin family protein [Aestuariibaculum sediminum]MBD0830627.1 thioredoxin family protein [Aestuariibaculum sediminum]
MNKMKKLIYIVLAVALMPLLINAQGITFEKGSFNQALEKAKKENKLLFVDGYAVWCGPCKRMEKEVFTDERIASLVNENMISFKLDVERGEGPKLKSKYRINTLPGFVFLNGEGEVIYRLTSSMEADEFLEEVKKALEFKNDPNSLGRLAELYETNKDDETFVRRYLDKLIATKSTNYVEVLEQYLSIQTTMEVSSKDMVMFLADHMDQIVVGGLADNIIDNNIKTTEWKKYVRKDIREKYLRLPKNIIKQTTEYAIRTKDTTKLELALYDAKNSGLIRDLTEQRERLYTHYFLQTSQGDRYKALVYDDIVNVINSIDKENLRDGYLELKERRESGDLMAKSTIHHATKYSGQILSMVKPYSKFAETPEEQAEVLEWVEVANYIKPDDAFIVSDYADILYRFGQKEEALKVKERAVKLAEKEESKRAVGIKKDFELMKSRYASAL